MSLEVSALEILKYVKDVEAKGYQTNPVKTSAAQNEQNATAEDELTDVQLEEGVSSLVPQETTVAPASTGTTILDALDANKDGTLSDEEIYAFKSLEPAKKEVITNILETIFANVNEDGSKTLSEEQTKNIEASAGVSRDVIIKLMVLCGMKIDEKVSTPIEQTFKAIEEKLNQVPPTETAVVDPALAADASGGAKSAGGTGGGGGGGGTDDKDIASKLSGAQTKLNEAKQKYDEAVAQKTELENTKQEYVAALAEKQTAMDTAVQTKSDLEGALSSLVEPDKSAYMQEDANGNITYPGYDAAMEKYIQEKQGLEGQIKEQEGIIAQLQEDIDGLNAQINEVESKISAKETEIQTLKTELDNAQKEMEQAQTEYDTVQQEKNNGDEYKELSLYTQSDVADSDPFNAAKMGADNSSSTEKEELSKAEIKKNIDSKLSSLGIEMSGKGNDISYIQTTGGSYIVKENSEGYSNTYKVTPEGKLIGYQTSYGTFKKDEDGQVHFYYTDSKLNNTDVITGLKDIDSIVKQMKNTGYKEDIESMLAYTNERIYEDDKYKNQNYCQKYSAHIFRQYGMEAPSHGAAYLVKNHGKSIIDTKPGDAYLRIGTRDRMFMKDGEGGSAKHEGVVCLNLPLTNGDHFIVTLDHASSRVATNAYIVNRGNEQNKSSVNAYNLSLAQDYYLYGARVATPLY